MLQLARFLWDLCKYVRSSCTAHGKCLRVLQCISLPVSEGPQEHAFPLAWLWLIDLSAVCHNLLVFIVYVFLSIHELAATGTSSHRLNCKSDVKKPIVLHSNCAIAQRSSACILLLLAITIWMSVSPGDCVRCTCTSMQPMALSWKQNSYSQAKNSHSRLTLSVTLINPPMSTTNSDSLAHISGSHHENIDHLSTSILRPPTTCQQFSLTRWCLFTLKHSSGNFLSKSKSSDNFFSQGRSTNVEKF